jgi:hypothetical protein
MDLSVVVARYCTRTVAVNVLFILARNLPDLAYIDSTVGSNGLV